MFFTDDFIELVRNSNDIVDVISGYVRLNKKGSTYFGLCPFHNEKSPSFSVTREKQMYYCFGCAAGGNVFTFIMEYENYTFIEAIKLLAERARIPLPDQSHSEEDRQKQDLKSTLLQVNKLAALYYYKIMKSEQGEIARQYFESRRISSEMIVTFGLGYTGKYSTNLYRYLTSKGYSEDILLQAGLISINEKQGAYDRFWNRVMFPIMDANNRVIGFGGRVLGDGKPKYLNSPETLIFDKSRNLYGLHRARISRKDYMLVCEGYTDVIALHQAGFTNAVATLGTALTSGHASLLKRYVKEVYLVYDSDTAGVKAALRAIPLLKDVGIATKVVNLSPYKDPDELILALTASEFEKRIQGAMNGFQFSIHMLEQEYDLSTPDGKTSFFEQVATRLLGFEDELERDHYEEAVARMYQIDQNHLHQLVVKLALRLGHAKTYVRPQESTSKKTEKEESSLLPQRVLLASIAEDKELYQSIRDYITPHDFTKDLYRRVAELLYHQLEQGEVNIARIVNQFTQDEEHKEVASIFYETTFAYDSSKEGLTSRQEVVIRVKTSSLEQQRKQLDPSDLVGLQNLLTEQKRLDQLKRIPVK